MPKVKIYTMEGKAAGERMLPDALFKVTVDPKVVAEVVRVQRANRRIRIAHTKTRADVRGGGRKPWRQKGTGRARHGSIRSPIWKGGGVTHGPRSDRNYELKLNDRTRKRALAMTLSDRVNENAFGLVDELLLAEGKPKLLSAVLAKLPVKHPVLIAVPESNSTLYRASRNLKGVEAIRADSLNVEAIVGARTLVAGTAALDRMLNTYARGIKA